MQDDYAQYISLFMRSTNSYRIFGVPNDPTLAEYLFFRALMPFVKKRFLFGPSILLRELYEIRSYIAYTGALIALLDRVETSTLAVLSEPRMSDELRSSAPGGYDRSRSWQAQHTPISEYYDTFVTRFGRTPSDLNTWVLANQYFANDIDVFRDKRGVKRMGNAKVGVKNNFLDMIETSNIYLIQGIVAAVTYPELCDGIMDEYAGNRLKLELCREWAENWRPQFTYLFEDV